jgi:nucleotide-binding universal stress UspA family protein
MGPIVCATRGGEASRRTQERAIALAKERKAELVFLFVLDPGLARTLNGALAAAVEQEQEWLGRALLGIAQARAHKEGVEARAVIRRGPVLDTIEAYLRQVEASTLVIGEPRAVSTSATFHPGKVHHFAEQIGQDTGVEAVVVVATGSHI